MHGITSKDVEETPKWPEVRPAVAEFIEERPLVAHNIAFDGYFLKDLDETCGMPPFSNARLCTLRMARLALADEIDRKSLDKVLDHYFPGEPSPPPRGECGC
ncbi:PolC-type DNA polymerase III [Corynebacterium pelargi]|uniref:3'-5' exonuclease n=1 Tax=Corynebacterium pelargi TaxID=1471400 RepID=UPI0019D6B5DD